jgi:signal transduction histidine kinase
VQDEVTPARGRAAGRVPAGARAVPSAILSALVTGPAEVPSPPTSRWRIGRWVGLVLYLLTIAMVDPAPGPDAVFWATFLAMAVALVLLALNRPLGGWRCAFLAVLMSVPAPEPTSPTITLLICLYVVAARYEGRLLAGASLVSAAALGFAWAGSALPALGAAALVLVPAVLGYNVHARHLAQAALADEEVRRQEEKAARALLEERSRIARELHDVVAHHMSVIAIHAETAPYKMPDPPAELAESFAVIRSSALEALTEMRRLLGVLRAKEGETETAPQPGLDRVEDLVAGARGSGMAVELQVTGQVRALPPGVELSAYRIVQEGLSNALRYAPGAHVQVTVDHGPYDLRLRVLNSRPAEPPAPGAAALGSGHGLLGMRERVSMLGGKLVAWPTPEGGFVVEATLPVDAADVPAETG